MNKEERILKYINTADELVFSGKRYYENDFYNDVENLVKENQELKKQLENKYSKTGILTNEVLYEENTKLINQQKKFIEYLEYQVKFQEELNDIHLATGFEEILSKYKEIIGVSDEKK